MSATTEQFVEKKKSPFVEAFEKQIELARTCDKLKKDGKTFSQAIKEIDDSKANSDIKFNFLANDKYKIFCPGDLVENKKGLLIPKLNSPVNMELLITSVCEYKVRFNLLKSTVQINGRQIEDSNIDVICNKAKEHELNFSDKHVIQVINCMARKDSFHPFKEFVEGQKWDGIDRISQLTDSLKIREDFQDNVATYQLYVRRWLIATIAKVYSPGAQNVVLTLQGDQGKGKDRWLRRLMPVDGCYGEGRLEPSNKDHIFRHLDFIIWHASEVDGTIRKSDIAALKDYFTRENISERPAYGRYDRTGKTTCSFAASVNDAEFLNDSSGSRRFLVIPIDKMEYEHEVDIQQLWAQVKTIYESGERYWFNQEEIETVNENNTSFTIQDKVDTIASKVVPGDQELPLSEIYELFVDRHGNRSELTKLGILLTKKGIKSCRKRINGILLTVYSVQDNLSLLR